MRCHSPNIRYILFVLLHFFATTGFSQNNNSLVSFKNYGGSLTEYSANIIATPDGGHVLCGTTNSNNNDVSGLHGTENDIWVVKLNKQGVIQWQKTYDSSYAEDAAYIVPTSDGGYAVAATANTYTGFADPVVIRLDANGNVLWRKKFGGTSADRAIQLTQTTDGGFVVTGETIGTPGGDFAGLTNHGSFDMFVSKISSTGTLLWSKIYGGSQHERGFVVKQLSDGNLLVAARAVSDDGDVTGNHNNFDNGDYWVLKLNPSGDVIWKKCYGGLGDETPYNAIEKNNRYYLIGNTMNISHAASGDVNGVIDGYDMWMLVLDTAGTIVRQKCIGGTISVDNGYDIQATLDGKFMISGYTQSNDVYVSGNHGLTDLALIKVDSLGNLVWSKLFGSSNYDYGGRVAVNADSSYSLLGDVNLADGDVTSLYGQSDLWLVTMKDSSLYPDLYSKLTGSTSVFTGNKINYKLNYGKLTSLVAPDTVMLQFIKDSRMTLFSSSKTVSLVSGDTLIWKIAKSAFPQKDSILLKFTMDPALAFSPDSFIVRSVIGPYNTEYFQANNTDSVRTKMRYQNAAIINPVIHINSVATVPTGKKITYTIPFSFQSALDTTRGFVRMLKDPKTDFVSASPPAGTVSGDTITWNFSTTANVNTVFSVVLQVKDTPVVQLGNLLKFYAILQFNTIDTAILKKTDSLQQLVNSICLSQSTVNTTLPYPQGIQWQRNFGGSGDDYSQQLLALSDSSFAMISYAYSEDQDAAGSPLLPDGFVTKYYADGTMAWKKAIGGNGYDYSYTAAKTAGGGMIVASSTSSTNGPFAGNHGSNDIVLTKLDSAGNTIWQKLYGGSNDDGYPLIRRVSDDKYVVLTYTYSHDGDVINSFPNDGTQDRWLFAVNGSGTMLWQKTFQDTLFSEYTDLQVMPGKEIMMSGHVLFFDAGLGVYRTNGRLVKTDSLGNIMMLKDYPISLHNGVISSMQINADSSCTFAGNMAPAVVNGLNNACLGDHGEEDVWVAKVDKNGNLLWQKFYGGPDYDYTRSIISTTGGGYLLTGSATLNGGNVSGVHEQIYTYDFWLLKVKDNGDLEWQKAIGGNGNDEGYDAIQLANNDFIVLGNETTVNNGDFYGNKGSVDVKLLKLGAANFIRGYVYSDNNGNHIKDAGEPYFNEGIVKSEKAGQVRSSDILNGFYANSTDTGTYITSPVINVPYYNVFPASHTTVFNGYLQADSVNFAMVPVPGINDLQISLLPLNAVRPGFQARYKIKYSNIGTTTIASGNVKLQKDHRVSYDSASVAVSSAIADTLQWNFTNLAPLQSKEIIVYLKASAPPTLVNGDTLHYLAYINPVAADTTPLDNSAVLNQLVTGSFDPNDKTETHGPGFPAQLLANGEYLNYMIRFQNTGTDTAFRVVVRDTLDSKLDLNSLQMVSASHAYRLSVDQNKLEWKFDPIVLPDSAHSEASSHGYIAYRIKPRSNLLAGDTIANRAGIYFDFNLPVMTNNQLSIIDNGMSICPGTNAVYRSGINGGIAYQWQADNGSGFSDISNSVIYAGVNTDSLKLLAPPTSNAGYKYRCRVTTASGQVYGPVYQLRFGVNWTGAAGTAWENPANWSCGVLPDANTDVLIRAGNVQVNSNVTIRSITVNPGVQLLVSAGMIFTIKH